MTKKERRAALHAAINKLVLMHLKVERTYTDLIRTNDQEEKRRAFFERHLERAQARVSNLIQEL